MKNIVIGFLVLVIAVLGYYLYKSHKQRAELAAMVQNAGKRPGGSPPRPPLVGKGSKLTGSPLEPFAYKLAPGAIPSETTAKLVGFAVTTKTLSDGSEQVTLAPKDSEDQLQQYTVKPGESLYFIEMTPVDDKADSDKDLNYRDDYAIITDAQGILQ